MYSTNVQRKNQLMIRTLYYSDWIFSKALTCIHWTFDGQYDLVVTTSTSKKIATTNNGYKSCDNK